MARWLPGLVKVAAYSGRVRGAKRKEPYRRTTVPENVINIDRLQARFSAERRCHQSPSLERHPSPSLARQDPLELETGKMVHPDAHILVLKLAK
jgi:hypothetical protein